MAINMTAINANMMKSLSHHFIMLSPRSQANSNAAASSQKPLPWNLSSCVLMPDALIPCES
jgi:hypothetical protein